MGRLIDLVGKVFSDLTVVAITTERAVDGSVVWECRCECGNTKRVSANHLKNGSTKSCGCVQRKHQIFGSITHGHSVGGKVTSTYAVWAGMIQRCTNPNSDDWENYGGRGITVCDSWMLFDNFLNDMGEAPPGLLIDRQDNNKGYEPGNCRWVTRSVSNTNRRPFNIERNKT